MIDPELIEQLKKAGYPFRPDITNLERIPPQTYRKPTEADLLHALGRDFKSLVRLDVDWEASNSEVYGEVHNDLRRLVGIGKSPLEALINLYIAVHKK